jgi:hypothetical protein
MPGLHSAHCPTTCTRKCEALPAVIAGIDAVPHRNSVNPSNSRSSWPSLSYLSFLPDLCCTSRLIRLLPLLVAPFKALDPSQAQSCNSCKQEPQSHFIRGISACEGREDSCVLIKASSRLRNCLSSCLLPDFRLLKASRQHCDL